MSKRASILAQKHEFFKESDPDAAHPVDTIAGQAEDRAVWLPVDRIQPDPDQPRKTFSEEAIDSLATSIKEKGLLQPISVRKSAEGFILIAGERRWRAHQKAGKAKIRAFITNIADPNEAFEISLIENLQREDLTPFEEAAGIAELMKRKHYKQTQVVGIVGRSKTQVSKLLKLNDLPPAIRGKVATSQLSRDQLFQIAGQETPEAMLKLYDRIVRLGLNVQETRQAAKEEEATPQQHPLISQLRRFERTLSKAHLDGELASLEGEEKQALSATLDSLSGLISKLQQQLWDK